MARNALGKPDIRNVHAFIYALCEPMTGEIRYVGKAASPQSRLVGHTRYGSYDIKEWIGSLRQPPALRVLEVVPPGCDVDARERFHIEANDGPRLLNRRFVHRPTTFGPRSNRRSA